MMGVVAMSETVVVDTSVEVERFEALWKIGDVADYLAVSPKTVEKMRAEGGFPAAVVFGRNVRWVPAEIRVWAYSRKEQYDAGEQWAV
jgi:predicted DNA-binding transcriptional regulator AlpA